MPSRKKHLEFDDYLRNRGNILEDTKGTAVHNRLDKHAKTYGPTHRDDDEWHSHQGARAMIDNIVKSLGMEQDRATDYVRIAHGHESLDYMTSKLKRQGDCRESDLDWDYVYRRTWKYMKSKRLHRARYKEMG
jgi:hypothetical protein